MDEDPSLLAVLDGLDDVLLRLRLAVSRPSWRRQMLDGAVHVVTLSELRVLRAVERRSIDGRCSVGDVADDLGIEHSSASRAVSGAERRGLLARSTAEGDQRRTHLVLTPSGVGALEEMTARRRRLIAETVVDWHPDQLSIVVDLMERLADDFDAVNES